MPRYTTDVSDTLLYEEDVRGMFNQAKTEMERAFISILWLTGARPSEILMLTKERIKIDHNKITILMPTLKLGGTKSFTVKDRTLEITRDSVRQDIEGRGKFAYQEAIVQYVNKLVQNSKIFPRTVRWAEKLINKLSLKVVGKILSPYHFRHSFFVWFARGGASLDDLMNWKGALSVQSVSPYLRAKPRQFDPKNLKRSRSEGEGEATKQQ